MQETVSQEWRLPTEVEIRISLFVAQAVRGECLDANLASSVPINPTMRRLLSILELLGVDILVKSLVVAQKSNRLYKAPPGPDGLDSVQGMYSILTGARLAFDVVLSDDLSAEKLNDYSALIFPYVAWMSDAQRSEIESFVQRRGLLLANFEMGLFDENGIPRNDFALAGLFDIHKARDRKGSGTATSGGRPANPGVNSEQHIERQHAIVSSFKETTLITRPELTCPNRPHP